MYISCLYNVVLNILIPYQIQRSYKRLKKTTFFGTPGTYIFSLLENHNNKNLSRSQNTPKGPINASFVNTWQHAHKNQRVIEGAFSGSWA